MHQHPNAQYQYEIVHDARVGNVHLFQELRGLLVMTIEVVALEIHPVEPVHSVQKTVKAGAEVGYVEHPSEQRRGVHVTDAKSKYGEQHREYGPYEYRDLRSKVTRYKTTRRVFLRVRELKRSGSVLE